jgi:hypothetical protein
MFMKPAGTALCLPDSGDCGALQTGYVTPLRQPFHLKDPVAIGGQLDCQASPHRFRLAIPLEIAKGAPGDCPRIHCRTYGLTREIDDDQQSFRIVGRVALGPEPPRSCPPLPVSPSELKRQRIYQQLFALGNASVLALTQALTSRIAILDSTRSWLWASWPTHPGNKSITIDREWTSARHSPR